MRRNKRPPHARPTLTPRPIPTRRLGRSLSQKCRRRKRRVVLEGRRRRKTGRKAALRRHVEQDAPKKRRRAALIALELKRPGDAVKTQTATEPAHAERRRRLTETRDAAAREAPAEQPKDTGATEQTEASSFLKLRGRRIGYREAGPQPPGSARPALLAHCSASHSGQWRPLIADLARERRVFAPDFHSYGRSDPAPDGPAPAYLYDAAILAELISKADQPTHLIGHGFGGLVAARAARDHPDEVASLTLIEPAAFQVLEETEDPRRIELLETAAAVTALVAFDEPAQAARLYIDFWNGEGAFDALGPEPQAYVIGSAARIAEDLRAANLHAPGQMRLDDFRAIRAPVHLISGGRSRPPARAVVARLSNVLPHAQRTEIIDAGHMAAATEPGRINPPILRFIAALDGAPSR